MRAKTVSQRATKYGNSCEGDAENARLENAGRSKMQGWKMQEHLIVWKAVCKNACQCYHIAVQMC